MFKQTCAFLGALLFAAHAVALDVNTADKAALETMKGLGAAKAQAIVSERDAHGAYKDAADLADRVKGLSTRSVGKLVEQGMTFGGAPAPGKGARAPTAKPPAAQGKPRS
ncbi:ComEA family DNA-binding protein [Chitinasiproducens palmae]|uniref:Competence protein ComEA n=1 Tax=Chitinasiproducens palmae TaxID=1770053 RepID=A0A1H2PV15_9BURK|nr:helix-hairpin-helix domain-containing protein [Chitinasiproducens palmae]SDV51085.1 competence protein ComEA [Chitinasiproducens palmae]